MYKEENRLHMFKVKILAIILAAVVLLSSIGLFVYLGFFNEIAEIEDWVEPPLVNPNIKVTVIWDEPSDKYNLNLNRAYVRGSNKPNFLEICTVDYTSTRAPFFEHPPPIKWIVKSTIGLEDDREEGYKGETYFEYENNTRYYVKVPGQINQVSYVDSLTCKQLNTSNSINEINLHWWATFNGTVNIKTTVIWDEPDNDSWYSYCDTEPVSMHVIFCPTYRGPPGFLNMGIADEFNVTKINNSTYYGEISFEYRSDYWYAIRTPVSQASFDNFTIVGIDLREETNNITVHHWKYTSLVLKPAIYLYSQDGTVFSDSLTVQIPNGFATLTIPEVEMSNSISWNDFQVYPESQILYQENYYNYLFYEAEIVTEYDNLVYGWVIKNMGDYFLIDDFVYSKTEVIQLIREELFRLGLYVNEVDDFIDYWFYEKGLLDEEGTHILCQLSSMWIDYNFQLTTSNEYTTNRLFFKYFFTSDKYFQYNILPPQLTLNEKNTNFILHEWGIIF